MISQPAFSHTSPCHLLFPSPQKTRRKETHLLPTTTIRPLSLSHTHTHTLQGDREGEMSSRRSGGSRFTEEEMNELIAKLQSLLPESRRRNMGRASAAKLLKETCSYIKSLNREVDGLSDRLSALMSTMDSNSPQAEIIRTLLR